jgi:glycolate oxidase iron-sulfur subunit
MEGLFDHVHRATERVLAMNGYRVVPCDGQDCCGALHAHAGQHERAVELARTNIAALAGHGDALIAVNSAGCGAMLREYARLLQGDPLEGAARAVSYRVRDVTELLAARGPAVGGKVALRVAYDPPCHLHHAQRVVDEPAAVLAAIPGVERVEHDEADLCCGSAGSYTVAQPQMSRTVLARKIAALEAAAPDLIVTGNPGCVMQLAAGLAAAGHDVPVAHPVELLDWSYQTAGYYDG